MLIETSGSRMDHDEEKLNSFLKHVMENKIVLDGTVTNEPGKMKVCKIYVQFTTISIGCHHFYRLHFKIFTFI